MNTSQYDKKTRRSIKKELRTPFVKQLMEDRRVKNKALEEKLAERRDDNVKLRKAIQSIIDGGRWDPDWKMLGFEQKA